MDRFKVVLNPQLPRPHAYPSEIVVGKLLGPPWGRVRVLRVLPIRKGLTDRRTCTKHSAVTTRRDLSFRRTLRPFLEAAAHFVGVCGEPREGARAHRKPPYAAPRYLPRPRWTEKG